MFRVALLAVLALPAIAHAVPSTLQHSGRLLDAAGTPLEGNTDLRVTLYDDAGGTNSVWTDDFTANLQGGYFTLELGEPGNEVDVDVVSGGDLWIGVTIDPTGTPTALALQPIQSVPYAVQSQDTVGTHGTFTPTVHLHSGSCASDTDVTTTANGFWYRTGDLVHIDITDLPTGATHSGHCIARVTGLPFTAAHSVAFAMGEARGIVYKYSTSVGGTATFSARMAGGQTTIETRTTRQDITSSGFLFINGSTASIFVRGISGSYVTSDP